MLESLPPDSSDPSNPAGETRAHGAVVLCAIAVFIVIGIWFAFYFLAFLPRGIVR